MPLKPYTVALLASVPEISGVAPMKGAEALEWSRINRSVPAPNTKCKFRRCQAVPFWFSLTHLHADHFAADDDLHAPILLPSGNGIVVGNRVSLAEPFGGDGVCR